MNKPIKIGLLFLANMLLDGLIISLVLGINDKKQFSWETGWHRLVALMGGGWSFLGILGALVAVIGVAFCLWFLGDYNYKNKNGKLGTHVAIFTVIVLTLSIVASFLISVPTGLGVLITVIFAAMITQTVVAWMLMRHQDTTTTS